MLAFILGLVCTADAAESLNRLYGGVSVVPGPGGVGASAAWESRLGSYLWAGVAGFSSPVDLGEEYALAANAGVDRFRMRHGLNSTLAMRLPHAQPASFQWDVVGRLGGGVAWVTDLGQAGLPGEESIYLVAPALAGVGGVDLQFRKEQWGLRVGARAWALSAVDDANAWKWFMIRPQGVAEASWQW